MTSAREPFAPPPPLPLRRGGFFSSLAKGRVENPRLLPKTRGLSAKTRELSAESPRFIWKSRQKIVSLPIRCEVYLNGNSV